MPDFLKLAPASWNGGEQLINLDNVEAIEVLTNNNGVVKGLVKGVVFKFGPNSEIRFDAQDALDVYIQLTEHLKPKT
jgi:hypothetical protein